MSNSLTKKRRSHPGRRQKLEDITELSIKYPPLISDELAPPWLIKHHNKAITSPDPDHVKLPNRPFEQQISAQNAPINVSLSSGDSFETPPMQY